MKDGMKEGRKEGGEVGKEKRRLQKKAKKLIRYQLCHSLLLFYSLISATQIFIHENLYLDYCNSLLPSSRALPARSEADNLSSFVILPSAVSI